MSIISFPETTPRPGTAPDTPTPDEVSGRVRPPAVTQSQRNDPLALAYAVGLEVRVSR